MKHWGILFSVLYGVVLAALLWPAYATIIAPDERVGPLTFYGWPGPWIVVAVLVACQVLLYGVKVDTTRRRLRARRSVIGPVVAGTFLTIVLAFVGAWSAWLTVIGEDDPASGLDHPRALLVGLAVLWIGSALFLWRATRHGDPDAVAGRILRWLLRGSVLELLVAIPAHVITRQRGDCCAPGISAWGIVGGIAVAVMAIGPGAFFLLADRMARKRRAPA